MAAGEKIKNEDLGEKMKGERKMKENYKKNEEKGLNCGL